MRRPIRRTLPLLVSLLTLPRFALAQVPENLVVEGVPSIASALRQDVGRYLEFRAATFNSWHPVRREILISTRFADSGGSSPSK